MLRLLIVISIVINSGANAQPPSWSISTSSFQHSMTMVAFLSMDGNTLEDPADKIGAFSGSQVRGVASPIYVDGANRYLAYLTIYGNTEGDEITFKLYDHSAGKTVDVSKKVNFIIDGQVGSVFQAFSVANPALRTEADLTEFGFTDIIPVSVEAEGQGLSIVLEYDQPIDALQPVFTVSPGAHLLLDNEKVISGETILDFSQSLTFIVLSEDESASKSVLIQVTQRPYTDEPFSCTNVVTANSDGQNDYWVVNEYFKYRDHRFRIFDVNGRILHESTGYNNDWNGTYKGKPLDRGQYYYEVTNPATGEEIKGTILVMH